ncbi:MAG: 6-phosphogluconolactonase [Thiomargarita sp.]|nr:6-phosphogluconolactonase [Thiomargarita sp.]
MNKNTLIWEILDNPDVVAYEAYQHILSASRQAIAQNDYFQIVLAGGNTPKKTYQLLKNIDTNWSKWHIFYGDERCLPQNDDERNSTMVAETWLNHVAIPTNQIHIIPAELGAITAAKQYEKMLKSVLPFDLVLLGMGEDGHTASLFPKHYHSLEELVHPIFNAPKPPPERVSLSVATLCNTNNLLFLVTGENKRDAVQAWRQAKNNLPISKIQPQQGKVLIDQAAFS